MFPALSPVEQIIIRARSRTILYGDRAYAETFQRTASALRAGQAATAADTHLKLLTKLQAQETHPTLARARQIEQLALRLAELDPTLA